MHRNKFLCNKTTRCTNFKNLFCHETLHVSDSSSVHHQEFIHCTLSNGICHTGSLNIGLWARCNTLLHIFPARLHGITLFNCPRNACSFDFSQSLTAPGLSEMRASSYFPACYLIYKFNCWLSSHSIAKHHSHFASPILTQLSSWRLTTTLVAVPHR